MAVQKSKKSRSRSGMRRSHDSIALPTLSTDAVSGEKHLRHHMTTNGFYRGKQIIATPVVVDDEAPEEAESTA